MRYHEKRFNVRRLVLLGTFTAIALILSYIEFLLPPIWSAVPGIKLGLANVMVIYVLYSLSLKDAAMVSLVRVFLSAILFGTALTLAYSLAGAVLSLAAMAILKKLGLFSEVGVSIAGAVLHNLGQILVAVIVLRTAEIGYYMIILTLTGILSGVFVGLVGSLLTKYIKFDWSKQK
ncbi:MAG: Gx transporter family protein [Clostridia bacterium]|nr:Gx transporter family protein [Clostridia bacterium]